MKRIIFTTLIISLISIASCTPSPPPLTEVSSPKKITLDDAADILNISLLLPSRFEHIDAASEGMSNEDMGLGSDFSEVKLFLSEDPFQMIYGVLGISESRIEQAVFDGQIRDEDQIKSVIAENIMIGAAEEGVELEVPTVEITHPRIGDSAILGEGYIETYGFQFGFDTLWFRDKSVIVLIYSLYISADNVSLLKIAEEIENRLSKYSH